MGRALAFRVFAPALLGGCTLLSGAADLEFRPAETEDAVDGGAVLQSADATVADASPPAKKPYNDAAEPEEEDASTPMDAAVNQDGGSTTGPTTLTFTGQLSPQQTKAYGPFRSAAGTTFEARTTGSGDADLYLRFGSPPTMSNADCSAESGDATELCRRAVPSGNQDAYVMVAGFTSTSYTLTIKHVPAP